MCLIASWRDKDRIQSKFDKEGYIVVYKVLVVSRWFVFWRRLTSPIYRYFAWTPGWHKAHNVSSKRNLIIDGGFHGYINLEHARDYRDILIEDKRNAVIVKLKCHKSDLLGVAGSHVAFSKVYLSEEEYNKALGV